MACKKELHCLQPVTLTTRLLPMNFNRSKSIFCPATRNFMQNHWVRDRKIALGPVQTFLPNGGENGLKRNKFKIVAATRA